MWVSSDRPIYRSRAGRVGSLDCIKRTNPKEASLATPTIVSDAVYLDRIDQPVRIPERLRLRRHISIAARIHLRARRLAPHASRPITTECDVEDDIHVAELAVVIASSTKVSSRRTPGVRVGIAVLDVRRDVASCEVPHFDAG